MDKRRCQPVRNWGRHMREPTSVGKISLLLTHNLISLVPDLHQNGQRKASRSSEKKCGITAKQVTYLLVSFINPCFL